MVLRAFISAYGPLILVLENLHNFDPTSWQMLVQVQEVLKQGCLLITTTRPLRGDPGTSRGVLGSRSATYDQTMTRDLDESMGSGSNRKWQQVEGVYYRLQQRPDVHTLQLLPFALDETQSLLEMMWAGSPGLNATEDPETLRAYAKALQKKTGGLPLYVEKLVEHLRDQASEMSGKDFPINININSIMRDLSFQKVILQRVDRLRPSTQLTLKVASVMGNFVDVQLLCNFYPIPTSVDTLRQQLAELEDLNFLTTEEQDDVWEFNMVERDVVYEMLPFTQRRQLHARLAQTLEAKAAEDSSANLVTIAQHWTAACEGNAINEPRWALKAVDLWYQAAMQACGESSLLEGLQRLQKAADMLELIIYHYGPSPQQAFATLQQQFPDVDVPHPSHSPRGPPEAWPNPLTPEPQEEHPADGLRASLLATTRVSQVFITGLASSNSQLFTLREGAGNTSSAQGSQAPDVPVVNGGPAGPACQVDWNWLSPLMVATLEQHMGQCCLGMVSSLFLERLRTSSGVQVGMASAQGLLEGEAKVYLRLLQEHVVLGLQVLGLPPPERLQPWKSLISCNWCGTRSFDFEDQVDWQGRVLEGDVLPSEEGHLLCQLILLLLDAAELLEMTGEHVIAMDYVDYSQSVALWGMAHSEGGVLVLFDSLLAACHHGNSGRLTSLLGSLEVHREPLGENHGGTRRRTNGKNPTKEDNVEMIESV